MVESTQVLDERTAQAQLRDVAAVLALPAMWRRRDPADIVQSLLDVLVSLLRVDLAYVRLNPPPQPCPAIEAWNPGADDIVKELLATLRDGLPADDAIWRTVLWHPDTGRRLKVAAVRYPVLEATWMVAAASRRPDFPTAADRFLLEVTAELSAQAIEAAVVLRRAEGARARAEELAQKNADLLAQARQQTDLHVQLNAELRQLSEARDRARAEAEAERQRLRDLFMQAPAAIAVLHGPEHTYEFVNPPYLQIIGRSDVSDVLGRRVREVVPEAEPQGYLELLDRVYATGEPFVANELPAQLNRRGGQSMDQAFLHVVIQPYRDVDGNIVGLVAHAVEVTEQVRARREIEEARNAAQVLSGIVESSQDAIIGKTLDGVVTSWNAGAEQLYGYTAEEMVGQSLSRIIPADRPDELADILTRIRRGERVEHFESVRRRKDGRLLNISLTVSPVKDATGQVVGASAIGRDITEQVRAREALEESEQRFRGIFDQSAVGVAQTDPEGRFVLVNDRYCDIVGRSQEELLKGLRMQDITHEADLPQNLALFGRMLTEGTPFVIEKRYVRPDGSEVWVRNTVSRVDGPDGEIRYAVAVSEDISERRRAEEALRGSEQELADFFENAAEGLHWAGPDGIVLRVNQAELDMLGYKRDEYVGRHISEFHVDQEVIADILARLARGETLRDREARLRCKDGAIKHVLINSNVLWRDGAFVHTRCFTRDITERKQAELLVASEKTALERLAQGDSLSDVLEFLIGTVEESSAGRFNSSIALLSQAQDQFIGSIGSKLPESYHRAVEGMLVSTQTGSCCRAVLTRQAVIIPDVMVDSQCSRFADFIAPLGYRAAWSTLITGSDGKVLGTFASYARQPARPTEADQRFVEGITQTAALAIERTHAEQALRESEARFRMLADSAPVPIWVNRADGGCEFVNQAYLEFFGKTLEEVAGFGWTPSVHPEDLEGYLAAYQDAQAERRPFQAQLRVKRADGEYRWLNSVGLPRFGPAGDFLGYIGTNPDITDLKLAEAEVRRQREDLRAMLMQAPVPIAVLAGPDLVFELANPGYLQVVGGRDILGKPLLEAMPELQGQGYDEVLHRVMQTAEPVVGEESMLRVERNGRLEDTYWTFIYAPLRSPDGVADRVMTICNEVTEQVRARREVEDALRLRDDFLSAAAHDLRTPVASMKGYAQLLLRQAARGDLSPSRLNEGLGQVESAATRMTALIDELLDISRVRAGETLALDRWDQDLLALARRVVAVHQANAPRHQLRVDTTDEEIVGQWDGKRLERVIDNLVGNAIKYSPNGGEILVTVAREGGWGVLSVRDAGLGIPATDLPYVFERFRRGENVAGRIPGNGIGLTSARFLIEEHGGTISVESEEGKGSSFTVRLPIAHRTTS